MQKIEEPFWVFDGDIENIICEASNISSFYKWGPPTHKYANPDCNVLQSESSPSKIPPDDSSRAPSHIAEGKQVAGSLFSAFPLCATHSPLWFPLKLPTTNAMLEALGVFQLLWQQMRRWLKHLGRQWFHLRQFRLNVLCLFPSPGIQLFKSHSLLEAGA